jgi:hypothetical protein
VGREKAQKGAKNVEREERSLFWRHGTIARNSVGSRKTADPPYYLKVIDGYRFDCEVLTPKFSRSFSEWSGGISVTGVLG